MSVDTFIPASVYAVDQRGDILRRVRGLHPRQDALEFLASAEAAAETSSLLLENAHRQHQDNLDRVDRARKALLLATFTRQDVCPEPVPFVATGTLPGEMTAPYRMVDGRLFGRIVDRDRLTDDSKTAGTLRLDSGETLRWTAGAAYVDALDVLFNGVPISLRGPFIDDGSISIQEVQPAPREHWADTEDYELAAGLGPMTVMSIAFLKRDLMAARGPRCEQCSKAISKPKKASIAEHSNGTHTLLCRPCKDDWNRDGRPVSDAQAEVA